MEFGCVPENELNKIDFSLPKEFVFNKAVLSVTKNKNAKVYIECAFINPVNPKLDFGFTGLMI